MAMLKIKVTDRTNLTNFSLFIDNQPVAIDQHGNGTVSVAGVCGDNSRHVQLVLMEGPAGANFSDEIYCGNQIVDQLKGAKIYPQNVPYGASPKWFHI